MNKRYRLGEIEEAVSEMEELIGLYQRRIEIGLEQWKRLQVIILQLLDASLLLPVLIQRLLQPDKNLHQLRRVDGL